jgi:hypothetical protein
MKKTNVENIKGCSGVDAGLLVGGVNDGRLGLGVRVEGGVQVNLEASSNLVLKLNGILEGIGSRPCLSENKTVFLVGELGLELALDFVRLCVAAASNTEGNAGRSLGLDFEVGSRVVVVLAQKVVGGLAKILGNCQSL